MSSIDHHQANHKRGGAALDHAGVSHPNLYPHVKQRGVHGGATNFPATSQSAILHKIAVTTVFPAITPTDRAFASSSYVDIRVPPSAIATATGFSLAFEIENDTADIVTLPAWMPQLFDNVQILAEGGNVQIMRLEPHHLMAPFRHVPEASWDKFRIMFSSGQVMNPGVIATTHLPILNEPFSRNHAYMGAIRSDIYVRVTFRGPSAFQALAAGVVPKLKSLSLIVSHDMHPPPEKSILHDRALSQSLDYRFGRPGYVTYNEVGSVSGRYSFTLSAIQGIVTELLVTIRLAGAAGADLTSYLPWESYELQDGSGAPILGAPVTKFFQRYVQDPHRHASKALESMTTGPTTPIVIEFGDAAKDFHSGTLTGYYTFSGTERLIINAPGESGQPIEVRVEYLTVSRLNIDRGRISVFPS